ncbi:MAG: hypothetical protein AAB818_01760 [Patescibacteria group bacterium]
MKFLNNDYDLLVETSDDTQLYWLDKKLISLREEKNSYRGRHSRLDTDIENDTEEVEFRRKLLLEKMSVSKPPKIEYIEKWYQKWWGQIIVLVVGGLILSLIVYIIGLNNSYALRLI